MSNNNINKKNFYYVNYVISHFLWYTKCENSHLFGCSKHWYRNSMENTHIKVQVAAGLTGFLLS